MIRVDVLGGLRISDADRVYAELPHQPMRAALLVLLAVERTLTRDRILATLWPDRDSERGRRALNQTVYELRRTLGDGVIVVTGDSLAAGDALRSDFGVFHEAAANGDRAAALELYRGAFLSGVFLAPTNEFEDWAARHRSRIGRLERKLRLELIDELRQAGRAEAALPYAVRAVEEDPLEDDYQHRLIALLIETGQRAAALRQFEAYRARLAEQDLAPLEETRELVAGIRAPAEATSATTPSPPPPLTPTGDPGVAPRRRPARPWPVAAGLVLALLAGALFLQDRPPADPPAGTAAVAPEVTVVVMEDLSPEPRYAYLARGLTEAVVDALQRRMPRVRVVALDEAALAARGGGRSPALGVPGEPGHGAALRLDGSLTVDRDSVRVRVRLIDMTTGALVRPIEVRQGWQNELALIDSMVPAIVEQLQPVLGQHVQLAELRADTRSAEAFALYLRAMEAREAGRRLSAAADYRGADRLLVYADSLLAHAAEADPGWSRAAALRARIGRTRAMVAASVDQDMASPRVRAILAQALHHADQAVDRAPDHPDALAARGAVRFTMVNFGTSRQASEYRRALTDGAEADLHRAVSADPLAAEAWTLLARVHSASGEWRKALEAARQAYRADAFLRHEAEILDQLFTSSFQLHRDDDAARWCAEIGRRLPGSERSVMCHALLFAMRDVPAVDSALATMRQAREYPRYTSVPMMAEMCAALAHARSGNAERALALLREIHRLGTGADDGVTLEAAVHDALGHREEAIRMLREYHARRPFNDAILKARWLDDLRTHPDFPRPAQFD